jgi:selenocysteine lyase/cysteine desulfurase
MKSNPRREFMRQSGLLLSGFSLTGFSNMLSPELMTRISEQTQTKAAHALVTDESFWREIRQAYTINPGLLNLNSGGVSPSTQMVQDAVDRYNRMSNEAPSYYMWRILDQGREPLRSALAQLAGCDAEEIAINRNATEAINTVIFGLPLQKGDEVVLSKMDYPNMIHAWKQREKRDGIKLVWVDIPIPCDDATKLTQLFRDAFTNKTKVVHITQVINWNGQVLPVRAIADIAKSQNIKVLVDGAHAFAQMDFKIPDLNCDYYGTSLHKWMCGPLGSGMLYIRKPMIADIWPLLSHEVPESDDIRKFESLGTRSMPIEYAIYVALDFHNRIGTALKRERLMYLRNYWVEQVSTLPGVRIPSPVNIELSCALATFSIQGMTPQAIEKQLLDKHKIHTVAIERESLSCVRVTPNVFTLKSDLDRFIGAVSAITKG